MIFIATFTKIREDEFEQIKKFQQMGITVKIVGKITNRSYNTIKRVFNNPTYQDYKNTIPKRKPKAPIGDALGLLYEDDLKEILSKLDQILKNQEKILNSPIYG